MRKLVAFSGALEGSNDVEDFTHFLIAVCKHKGVMSSFLGAICSQEIQVPRQLKKIIYDMYLMKTTCSWNFWAVFIGDTPSMMRRTMSFAVLMTNMELEGFETMTGLTGMC